MMHSREIVMCFILYVSNKWSLEEANQLFGQMLGFHIYEKFFTEPNKLAWFANLDKDCQTIILNRAIQLYGIETGLYESPGRGAS